MPDPTPVPTQLDASTALHDELAHERVRGLHRINLLRLWGVSAFFALFLSVVVSGHDEVRQRIRSTSTLSVTFVQ